MHKACGGQEGLGEFVLSICVAMGSFFQKLNIYIKKEGEKEGEMGVR